MLIRDLSSNSSDTVEPAFSAFLKTQSPPTGHFGFFLQSEHSRLAGSLASALEPHVFGELNADVIAAIAHHDYGWDRSDAQQIEHLTGRRPCSFITVTPQDTLPSWVSSIAHGRGLGRLPAVLISRHCCLLGTGSEAHAQFVAAETHRRREIESDLNFSDEQLNCWTAALGFCDLLSLYLCSGSRAAVRLPLCHPENQKDNRNVTLRWLNDTPTFSEPVFKNNICYFARGWEYFEDERSAQPLLVTWTFSGHGARRAPPSCL